MKALCNLIGLNVNLHLDNYANQAGSSQVAIAGGAVYVFPQLL